MMDINEHQDQRFTRGDNNGRDLYLLGVNVLVKVNKKSDYPNNDPSLNTLLFRTSFL